MLSSYVQRQERGGGERRNPQPCARQALQEAGVNLAPAEPAVDLPACVGASSATLGGALGLVVPVAQRPQVGVAVVVATDDVVYIGRQLGASDAIVAPGAAVAVPAQDAAADGCPVVGEVLAPVRSAPLGHVAPLEVPRARTSA